MKTKGKKQQNKCCPYLAGDKVLIAKAFPPPMKLFRQRDINEMFKPWNCLNKGGLQK